MPPPEISPEPNQTEWHSPEGNLRLLVESVKDYALIMLNPDGVIVSWNAGAERINGYSEAEVTGRHFSLFYSSEDIRVGKPESDLQQALRDGRIEDEGWRIRNDGRLFWANTVISALRDSQTGELCGYGNVIRDLTERKLAEEKLRQSEEQFRLLVEGVEEYAIFMLDVEGHVVTWNLGAQKAKGYLAIEIIGKSFEQFYTPQERGWGKPRRLLNEARVKGHARDQGVRVRKDGSTFYADVLITAIHDAQGKLRGYTKLTRDITDQIRSQELEAARLAAEESSKAKDDFLAALSHELRTPLTPVVAAVSYISENADKLSREELVEEIEVIRRNVLLEARLIDDLLDLTRISRGKIELRLEAVDAHTAIEQALEVCRQDVASRHLDVIKDLCAAEHWVWSDATRLGQIFWNLMNNAVKFTPPKGRIEVRSRISEPGLLCVEFIDSGVGIEPELALRIFNAFEQGERSVTRRFGGLGLGLAITKSLVTMQGGTIDVQSEGRGKGSTFRVTLPLTQESIPVNDQKIAHPSNPSNLHILLVDDHDDTRRVLSRLLTRAGYKLETADDVQSALAKLGSTKFHILISDVGLPDGTGHELIAEAKLLQPKLHAIALSGFGMDEDQRRSIEAGFDFHLNKPIDFLVLSEKLKELELRILS